MTQISCPSLLTSSSRSQLKETLSTIDRRLNSLFHVRTTPNHYYQLIQTVMHNVNWEYRLL